MSSQPAGEPIRDLTCEIEEAVAKALVDCGRSTAWRSYVGKNQTDLVATLEGLSGCEHVGLASSGTAALEMLLTACRLKPGEEVLLSGYDYPGTFAAIERAGARPALVDVAEESWNLSWESLEATVTPACRVLIVSHLHGQLQPIAQLERWCAARRIWLIQDACQALGATIDSRPIGQFGDATIFSFGGGKTISAGRGGAWGSRNAQLAQRARLAAGVGSGAHEMCELQAAVVLAQLPFLARVTERCRHYFAQVRADVAEQLPTLSVPWRESLEHTAFYQAGWLASCAGPEGFVPLSERVPDRSLEKHAPSHASHGQLPSAPTQHAQLQNAQSPRVRPHSASHGRPAGALPSNSDSLVGFGHLGSPLIGLSQSQYAELQRIGIGSGFPGYHRRSMRRCRIHAPLQNTARVAEATVTVHHRAALRDAPIAEVLAQILTRSVTPG